MKKITLILIILGVFIITNAQTEKEYNPYRYEEKRATQEKIYTEAYQEFLAKGCNISQLQKAKEYYNETGYTMYLSGMLDCNCQEAIDYAIELMNTSPDKEARKMSIDLLGFRRYYEAIPLLLEHVKKNISPDEKIVIAKALVFLDRKTEALDIFNSNCYSLDDMNDDCIWTYFTSFDYPIAIKYFEYYFTKPETQLEAACWLAILGIYDKTFPLFVEYLKSNTTYKRETEYSLVGLAAIGTEEAIEVIKQQTKNNTSLIARSATLILDRIMKERREK